jgi:hypothetical protein
MEKQQRHKQNRLGSSCKRTASHRGSDIKIHHNQTGRKSFALKIGEIAMNITPTTEIHSGEIATAETQTALVASKMEAEIKARYSLAIVRPRSNLELEQKLLEECKRPSFAASALYSLPRKAFVDGEWTTIYIVGPSIRLAETAARLARNISLAADVIFENEKQRIVKIQVCDIEANIVYSQDVIVPKTMERRFLKKDKAGKVLDEVLSVRINSEGKEIYTIAAPESELLIKQNANISKALRNQILRLVPGDILEAAVTECKKTQVNEAAKDPSAAKKNLVKAFAEIGITAGELSEYLGHAIDTVSLEEMANLTALGKSLKDGEVKWSEVYKREEPEGKVDTTMQEAKDKVKAKVAGATLPITITSAPANASKAQKKPSGRDLFNAEIYKLNKTHEQEIKKLLGLFGYESTSELKDTELDQFMAQLRLMKPTAVETPKKEAFL